MYSRQLLACVTGLAVLASVTGFAQTPSDEDRRKGASLTVFAPALKTDRQPAQQADKQPVSEDELGDLVSLIDNKTPPAPAETDNSISGLAQKDADGAVKSEDKSAIIVSEDNATNQPINRIGRNRVSQVGLSTIGLSALENQPAIINSMLWSQTNMQDAVFLIEQAPVISASETMRSLLHAVITQPALPPEGEEALIGNLVSAKLDWLAGSGQSDRLSELTRLLPDDDRWAEWRQWQVDYDLIRRADDTACAEAQINAQQSLDAFWQKANIVCLILVGEQMQAGFAADILSDMLSTNAQDDDNFFMLTNLLLGKRDTLSLDLDNLSFLHLVLMDAAHEQISLDAFETLPASMIQASTSFRYLSADAALKTSYDSYIRGLIPAAQVQTLWRAQGAQNQPAEAALAEIDAQIVAEDGLLSTDGLASAYLWIALSGRQSADTDLLIMQAFNSEVMARRGYGMLPFYASLVSGRMLETDGISPEITAKFEMIRALNNPQNDWLTDKAAISAQKLLKAQLDDKIALEDIEQADASSVIPILLAKGAVLDPGDWIAHARDTADKKAGLGLRYRQLGISARQALDLASQNGQVGKTILLAGYLIGDADLGWIAPADIAHIMGALKQIGLYDEADRLANEALKAHLLRLHFSASGR
jgi:hypothetical protein